MFEVRLAADETLSVFICEDCGYQVNADVNGAKNILKRAVGYMRTAGRRDPPDGERFVLWQATLPNLP